MGERKNVKAERSLFRGWFGNAVLFLKIFFFAHQLETWIFNIILLKYLDYTVVLPFTSLTYVWSAILAFVFLKEKIFGKQMLGLAMIVVGAFLLVV